MKVEHKPALYAQICTAAEVRTLRRPSDDALQQWWDYLHRFDADVVTRAFKFVDCDSKRMPTPADVRAFIRAERLEQSRNTRCMYKDEDGKQCDDFGEPFSIGHGHTTHWCVRHKYPRNRKGPANPFSRPWEPRGSDVAIVRMQLAQGRASDAVARDFGAKVIEWVEENTSDDEWAEAKRMAGNRVTRLDVGHLLEHKRIEREVHG